MCVVPLCTGEQGKAVIIDKDKLSPEERKKYEQGFQNNAFNQYASDMMSLHRSLPDVRDAELVTMTFAELIVMYHSI